MRTPAGAAPGIGYRERLTVPWWSWLVVLFWAGTLGVAFGHALGTTVGILVAVAAYGLATAGLAQVSTVVSVNASGLTVGAATLPPDAIGAIEVLDREAARRRRGPEADPRTFSCLRAWIPTAVSLQVQDPKDPTPSWFVSTRHPERLAEALAASRLPRT